MSAARLRAIRAVYQQVRWDKRFAPEAFVLGYEARGRGVVEVPLERFVPDGDVPWHRVRYLRVGETHVWDRAARVDLLLAPASLPAAARRASPAAPADAPRAKPARGVFSSRPAWRFHRGAHAWLARAPEGPAATAPGALRVVTYNVLFDHYEGALLATERRVPAQLALLAACDADVYALQEVTPGFLASLLREPWVREGYACSEAPDGGTIAAGGQVLLSRLPVAGFERHEYSRFKHALRGRLWLGAEALAVYALHLTSDHTAQASYLRAKQLRVLFAELAHEAEAAGAPREAPALVLGDLNCDAPEGADELREAGLCDLWPALRGDEPGLTYDPRANTLAAVLSRGGKAGRLDRVLLRDPRGLLAPRSIALLGTEPIARTPEGQPALFASDHFGLCAHLALAAPAVVAVTAGGEALARPRDPRDEALEAALARAAPAPDAAERARLEAAFARLREALDAVAPGASLERAGSQRAGLAEAGGDLDAVALGSFEHAPARLLRALEERLAGAPDAPRAVLDARVPVLRGALEGARVDLVYAALPEGVAPRPASHLERRELEALAPDERRAALGPLDVDALRDALRAVAPREPARGAAVARAVRAWARARDLRSHAFGFPGGFAWALLCAWALDRADPALDEGPAALLARVFARLAQSDLRGPLQLALGEGYAHPLDERDARPGGLVLLTPVAPRVNAARNVLESGRCVLLRELARAHALCERGAWPELFEPVDPRAEGHEGFVELAVRSEHAEAHARAAGWVQGNALGLLVALEREGGGSVRAYPSPLRDEGGAAPHTRWRVGLGRGASPHRAAPACASVRARFEAWRLEHRVASRLTARFVGA